MHCATGHAQCAPLLGNASAVFDASLRRRERSPRPDGHDFSGLVWNRAMRDDRPELHGTASHPQEVAVQCPASPGNAVKMI